MGKKVGEGTKEYVRTQFTIHGRCSHEGWPPHSLDIRMGFPDMFSK